MTTTPVPRALSANPNGCRHQTDRCRRWCCKIIGLAMLHPATAAARLVRKPLRFEDGISFVSDWSASPTGGFAAIERVAPDRLNRQGPRTFSGAPSALVTVKPGDDPIRSSGERSEVSGLLNADGKALQEGAGSGTQYFGIEVWFPGDYAAEDYNGDSWAIFTQLHGPVRLAASPVIALRAGVQKTGQLPRLSLSMCGGIVDADTEPVRYQFASDTALVRPGEWHRLLMEVTFAFDQTGCIQVWMIDAQTGRIVPAVRIQDIPTLQWGAPMGVEGHYWKQGLYRGLSRRIDQLALGRFVRAASLPSVLLALGR